MICPISLLNRIFPIYRKISIMISSAKKFCVLMVTSISFTLNIFPQTWLQVHVFRLCFSMFLIESLLISRSFIKNIEEKRLLHSKIQELKPNLLRNCGVSKHWGSHRWRDGNSHYYGFFFCFKNFYCAGKLDQRENGWMEQIMDVVCSMG